MLIYVSKRDLLKLPVFEEKTLGEDIDANKFILENEKGIKENE